MWSQPAARKSARMKPSREVGEITEVDRGGGKPRPVRPQLRRSHARRGGVVEGARQLHREFRLRLRAELRSPDRLLRAAARAVPCGQARAGGLGGADRAGAAAEDAASEAAGPPSRGRAPRRRRALVGSHPDAAAALLAVEEYFAAQRALDAGAHTDPSGAHAGRQAIDTQSGGFVTRSRTPRHDQDTRRDQCAAEHDAAEATDS